MSAEDGNGDFLPHKIANSHCPSPFSSSHFHFGDASWKVFIYATSFSSNCTYGVSHILLKMVLAIFKNEKDDLRNYRPVSLTLVISKITEKVILESTEKYLEDNAVTSYSQHNFMRRKSCLSNLISSYDRVTHQADLGKPVHVIFSDLSKDFYIVWHRILLDKMFCRASLSTLCLQHLHKLLGSRTGRNTK